VGDEPRTLDELFREAAALIERLSPADAFERAQAGAVIVDIRSVSDRERTGVVPGSIHVPRTVLEWRFEPGGRWRNPHLDRLDDGLVLLCDHGYSSVLAAAALVRLGHAGVADVVGGFEAWRRCGLPTIPSRPRSGDGGLPGMTGPD
jgi:rhodanese-related sulfurtransferase